MDIPWEKNFASAEIQTLDLSTHCYLEVSLKIAVGPPSDFTLVGPEQLALEQLHSTLCNRDRLLVNSFVLPLRERDPTVHRKERKVAT